MAKMAETGSRNGPKPAVYLHWGGLKFITFDEKHAITRKRNKIDAQFLLKSNRKSYVLYRMAMFPTTLGDP